MAQFPGHQPHRLDLGEGPAGRHNQGGVYARHIQRHALRHGGRGQRPGCAHPATAPPWRDTREDHRQRDRPQRRGDRAGWPHLSLQHWLGPDFDLPLPRTDTADLTVQAILRNVADIPQSGTLTGTSDGFSFKQEVSLAPNETRTVTLTPATTPALHLRKPRLWWPNGYGPQNLYKLRVSFTVNGTVSDAKETTFGVRKITYTLPGSDNLALSVNGVPVIAKRAEERRVGERGIASAHGRA